MGCLAGGGGVMGVRDQPVVHVTVSGTALDVGGEERRWRRPCAGRDRAAGPRPPHRPGPRPAGGGAYGHRTARALTAGCGPLPALDGLPSAVHCGWLLPGLRHRRHPGSLAGRLRPDHGASESPTLGLGHLQFEAPITAARLSANPNDFALIALLGLLGLRIFEACAANITDLHEEHGHPRRLAPLSGMESWR